MLAIGFMTLAFLAASGLLLAAAGRYSHAQLIRDRLQALECAQAGLLWARRALDAGETLPPLSRLDLGPAGFVTIAPAPEGGAPRLLLTGSARRDGEPQASRTLEVLLEEAGP